MNLLWPLPQRQERYSTLKVATTPAWSDGHRPEGVRSLSWRSLWDAPFSTLRYPDTKVSTFDLCFWSRTGDHDIWHPALGLDAAPRRRTQATFRACTMPLRRRHDGGTNGRDADLLNAYKDQVTYLRSSLDEEGRPGLARQGRRGTYGRSTK